MFRLGCRRSRARCAFAGRELFRHASRLRETRLAMRYRKACATSLAAIRKSDVHSAADSCRCRSRRREGNMPGSVVRKIAEHQVFLPLTRIAAWRDLAMSLSCSSLGLLPRISGSQNVPTAPFMCPIFPCAGAGAFTHCEGSRPTPHTMYA
jgi:hypothetical protein